MNLVETKCPNCGANIQVDPGKEAAICEYCGQPFVVERAIKNYGTINYGDNITNKYKPKDTLYSALKKREEAKIVREQEKTKRHKLKEERKEKFSEGVSFALMILAYGVFMAVFVIGMGIAEAAQKGTLPDLVQQIFIIFN